MIVQNLHLEKYDWDIKVYYAINEHFISNILIDLISMGCDKESYFSIKKLMESNEDNVGFTYSNTDLRCTLILIGKSNSAEEFQDTLDHEKGHAVMHISMEEHIDPFSEEYQYLRGEIAKKLFKVAKIFLCENCRNSILTKLES